MKRRITTVIFSIVFLLAFQLSSGETLIPSEYNLNSQYSISSNNLIIGDSLVISRLITNNESFSATGLYFSENLPPQFDVISARIRLNGTDIAFESHGPISNLIIPMYDNYTWLIDDPNNSAVNNIIYPGDSVEFELTLGCNNLGEYVIPLHTTVFYGNNQGLFSTSDSIIVNVVSSADPDTTSPEFVETCPVDAIVECGEIPSPPTMTATDDSDPNVNVDYNEIVNGSIISRTWTATDNAGNSTQCVQILSVEDNLAPEFVEGCPVDTTVESGSIPATIIMTAIDNCDPQIDVVYNEAIGSTLITRTWTATDDAGNNAQCVQSITIIEPIVDTTPPEFVETCPVDVTVECGNIPIPPTMTAIDNIDPAVNVDFSETVNGSIITRTWTATDNAGNSSQCIQILTVEDNLAPDFVEECPVDTTVESGSIPAAAIMTAIDNCVPQIDVVYNETIGSNLITRIWTATDESGNSAQCIQEINIDNGSQTFSKIYGKTTANEIGLNNACVNLYDSFGNLHTATSANETGDYYFDNLPDGNYRVEVTVPLGFQPATNSSIEITISGSDIEANFELTYQANATGTYNWWWWQKQFIYIQRGGAYDNLVEASAAEIESLSQSIFDHFYGRDDGYAIEIDSVTYLGNSPRPLTFEELSDIFLGEFLNDANSQVKRSLQTDLLNIASGRLGQFAVVSADGATASQALTYLAGLYQTGSDIYTANVNLQRMHMGTTIPSGTIPLNTINIAYGSRCAQSIADPDTTAPEFVETCPADTTVNCGDIPSPPTMTATDNIDPAVNVSYNEAVNGSIITRTWIATDNAGNSSQCIQTLTVEDNLAPEFVEECPVDTTVESGAIPEAVVMTASDNCDPVTDVVYNEALGSNLITRTWTATDESGNNAQCIQLITIIEPTVDTTSPEFVETCPVDTAVNCGDIPSPPTMTATDDYDSDVDVIYNEIIEGAHITRTWTATDSAGNASQCVQTLTVEDNLAPEFVEECPVDTTVDFDAIPDPPLMTAVDNCDPLVNVIYNEVIDSLLITRIWTATDESGNSAQCVQIINIDYGTPTFSLLYGQVTANDIGLYNAHINLFDSDGDLYTSASANESGDYYFDSLLDGDYRVELTVPLGFQPVTDSSVEVTISGSDVEVNFGLTYQTNATGTYNWWWWQKQFIYIQRGGAYENLVEASADEIDLLSQSIFDHFYSRDDGFAIQVESVTYTDNPPRPLTFTELSDIFLGDNLNDADSQVKRSLRANLLNIASGRMNQFAIVSADGATASQAITYLAELYLTGSDVYTANVNLQRMHMGIMIPSGVIPLNTANIAYKIENEFGAESGNTPNGFSIEQNYPNPFNPVTEIRFSLPHGSTVRLDIINIAGQKVETLADSYYDAGFHTIAWDASDYSSGIYLYRIEMGEFTNIKKMILLK